MPWGRWWGVLVHTLAACGPGLNLDEPPGTVATGGETETASSSTPDESPASTATSASSSDADPSTTDDRADATSTGASPAACMPEHLHGPEVPGTSVPGYTVYEGCDGGYFVEHNGDFAGTQHEVLVSIADGPDNLLFGQYDIISSGIGACCEPEGFDHLCIVLRGNISTFDLSAVMQWYADEFAEESRCFGLKFELDGHEGPRCEPDDPECGPLPVCDGHEIIEPACCQAPPHDPDAQRVPVAVEPVTDQPCTHDGECVVGGGGDRCSNWMYPFYPSILECSVDLAESYCGCVQDQCQWYEQV